MTVGASTTTTTTAATISIFRSVRKEAGLALSSSRAEVTTPPSAAGSRYQLQRPSTPVFSIGRKVLGSLPAVARPCVSYSRSRPLAPSMMAVSAAAYDADDDRMCIGRAATSVFINILSANNPARMFALSATCRVQAGRNAGEWRAPGAAAVRSGDLQIA
jgi:hypothetical protein